MRSSAVATLCPAPSCVYLRPVQDGPKLSKHMRRCCKVLLGEAASHPLLCCPSSQPLAHEDPPIHLKKAAMLFVPFQTSLQALRIGERLGLARALTISPRSMRIQDANRVARSRRKLSISLDDERLWASVVPGTQDMAAELGVSDVELLDHRVAVKPGLGDPDKVGEDDLGVSIVAAVCLVDGVRELSVKVELVEFGFDRVPGLLVENEGYGRDGSEDGRELVPQGLLRILRHAVDVEGLSQNRELHAVGQGEVGDGCDAWITR